MRSDADGFKINRNASGHHKKKRKDKVRNVVKTHPLKKGVP